MNSIFFITVALAFFSNILILYLSPYFIGFGNYYIAFIGLGLFVIGFIFWLGGMLSLGKNFRLFPEPRKLVTKGLYKITKHPIYVGITLTFSGLAIAKGAILALFFTLMVTTPLNIYRAKKEERELKEKFGVEYK